MKNAVEKLGVGKRVLVVVGVFTVIVGAMYMLGASAKEVYEPIAPAAEVTYQSARKTLCEAELVLVQAKLLDFANNALELSPDAVKSLTEKKQGLKCDF